VERNQKKQTSTRLAALWGRLGDQVGLRFDQCASALLQAENLQLTRKPYGAKLSSSRLVTPQDEVKKLVITAASLEDIWRFLLQRLNNGNALDFLCLSTLDEREEAIEIAFLYADQEISLAERGNPNISLLDTGNHLVQAYRRLDTTFSPSLKSLGLGIMTQLPWTNPQTGELTQDSFHLFSVPLIAGGQAVAMITLGFREMDSFSQAKLSYVYGLRDQIAQLAWNLIMKERMKAQSQVDGLTGLLSYSYFQSALEREITRAEQKTGSVTVMVLDINRLQDINLSLGHQAGDEAICHLASTVRRLIRGLDTVARYGGDEVAVILPEITPEGAQEVAQRFLEGLQTALPEALDQLSLSIGHATYPDDGKTREKLLKLAEQALHLAKFKGGNSEESYVIAASEIDQLSDKTVVEVFASQVAKKYDHIHVPSVYQELVNHIEKKTAASAILKTDDLMLETITSLAGALEAKDRYTRGHSQAVANYAVALAHALKMTPGEVEEIRAAAFLHDIGKIGIPEDILSKTGPLNEKEWEIMKQHPVIGAQQILYPVVSLRPIIPAVECHHENWDGSGHPHGLKGEKIPLGARIVSIVDAFHALTSERSYRKALPVAEARKILEAGSGSKWDPHLLNEFFKILTIAAPKPAQAETLIKPQQLRLDSLPV
jgi:diguanylate cyclase (GGDEF)-like protein/putative nucleotidyltransferase with HDIG domain